jgi:hypothetical protein
MTPYECFGKVLSLFKVNLLTTKYALFWATLIDNNAVGLSDQLALKYSYSSQRETLLKEGQQRLHMFPGSSW